MLFWFIAFLSLSIFIVYHMIKYRNPYKLIMVFGKKGSGKTTLMVKLSIKYNRKKRPVYRNVPGIPGTYYFDTDIIGIAAFPPESVIMVDEVGMVWDNRNFKNFSNEVRDYFKLQRHYKHTVYLFSQSFDIDKKLRDLTDRMYLVTNLFNCVSIARGIVKQITISHADKNTVGESKLVDDMRFQPLLLFWLGSCKITYIPRYAKYFDTYIAPALKPHQFDYTPIELCTYKQKFALLLSRCCWRRKEPVAMPGLLEVSADDDHDCLPPV